jgi:chitodextrinase
MSILKRGIWLSFLWAGCLAASVAQAGNMRPSLSGSFLQPGLGDQWTDRQWKKEFSYMKKAGLTQMVIQWTADSLEKTTIYPTRLPGYTQNTNTDVVERALRTADASGAQIYLGLQANNDWWTNYANDASWLQNEAKVGNLIADELWKKYGHHPSLTGWYLWFEVDNVNEPTAVQWNRLTAFFQATANHLHQLTPGKPVMISPFYNSSAGLKPSQWQKMWEYILSRSPLDILALQDGVGVQHAKAAQLPAWFKATGDAVHQARPKMRFWVDSETFNMTDQPMPIQFLVQDMLAVQPYVSNYISFSFNHYISPQQVNPLYYKTYLNYLATEAVEDEPPTAATGLDAVAIDPMTILLNWTASTDNFGVVGYKIWRNSEVVASVYDASPSFTDSGLDPNTTYTYQVMAFDAAGNKSLRSSGATATTPPKDPYVTDLALGKPYSASMPADASCPDTNGAEITDGIYGMVDYTDSAWQGRSTDVVYSFTIDLGSVVTIKELRSRWLQSETSAILLPTQVVYSVSVDNSHFALVGTVSKPAVSDADQPAWYTLTNLGSVSGRYVQVQTTPPPSAWTFVDEIEARQ